MDDAITNVYEKQNFQTYNKMGDIYCLFYDKGIELLVKNGILCYITSNKWMRAGYGETIREFFTNNVNPIKLIDLGPNVFECATVDTNILFLTKTSYQQKTMSCTMKDHSKTLIEYVKEQSIPICFDKSAWAILTPIEKSIKEKIEKYGTPLKDWDVSINYGIKTGCNEAFIIDGVTKDRLIKEDPKSAEIIRPILRGRDIKRYSYNFSNLYLITSHNGTPSLPRIKINKYTAIKKHLDKYYKQIKNRDDQGDTPYNLRSCAYMEDFFKQKIVWSETAQEMKFSIVEDTFVTDKTTFILLYKNLYYLLAFCNSKIAEFFIRNIASSLGKKGISCSKIYIEQLPIIAEDKIDKKIKDKIILLAKQLCSTKDNIEERIKINNEINFLLYDLYDFSKKEIEILEKLYI